MMVDKVERAVIDLNGEWPEKFAPSMDGSYGGYASYHGDLWMAGVKLCSKSEFMEARKRLENKPSWDDVPEWAEWIAQSPCGHWEAYSVKPSAGGYWHYPDDGRGEIISRGVLVGDWRQSLEPRPQPDNKEGEDSFALAWKAVHSALTKADPGWTSRARNGVDSAVASIEFLVSNKSASKEGEGVEWLTSIDGLPPVGVECEISIGGSPWDWCRIRFMGEGLCVVDHKTHNEQHYHLGSAQFRPIQSHRDKVIEAAHNVWNDNAHLPSDGALAAMYDEGLLKLPGEEE